MTQLSMKRTVVTEILRDNRDRKRRLVKLKLERMDADVFSFYRGTAGLYARAWSKLQPADPGPAVLICGDLHLENFGAFRADDGTFCFDINDFDEALVAPCSLDVVRCTCSVLLAAEHWRLSPLEANGIALDFLDEYGRILSRTARKGGFGDDPEHDTGGPIHDLIGATALGTQVQLLDHNTEKTAKGVRRIVRSANKHPEVRAPRTERIARAVERYGERIGRPEAYRVHDITGRVAGIGSLGLRRYLVLVEGDGSPDGNWLLDVKEERPSAMLACARNQPRTRGGDAQRVVDAQRRLQAKPVAGLDVIKIGTRGYRMRAMIPEENRSSLDRLHKNPDKLRKAVGVAGRLAGRAHVRGCDRNRRTARDLARWAEGPGLDAALASAARMAELARAQYAEFHKAMQSEDVEREIAHE